MERISRNGRFPGKTRWAALDERNMGMKFNVFQRASDICAV